jgi:hypothetical protein
MPRHHAELLAAIGGFAAILACRSMPAQAAGLGSWTQTNDPGELRELAVAAKLTDGRVLIAGGEGYQGVLTLTELFDPTTNSYTTPMNEGRENQEAVTLNDGRVLMQGGFASVGPAYSEVFTP